MRIKSVLLISTILLSASIILPGCEEAPEVSVNDHLNLARLYFKQGSFRASLIEGKNALQLEPDNLKVLKTMSDVLLKLNDYVTAERILTHALSVDKSNQDLKLPYVKALLFQGKKTKAHEIFNGIEAAKVSNISDYQKLKGDILFTAGKRAEAKSAYLEAIESNNKNIEAILGAAKAALLLKQDEEVKKYTTLATETAPNNIDAMIWQAQIHMLNQRHVKAEDVLSRAMIELERYDTLTANKYAAIDMLAKTLVAQGKIEESFVYSNYLAKSRPAQLRASYESAIDMIAKGGDISQAEVTLQNILKQAPKHKSSNIILGLINFEKGNYTEAEDYLSKFATDENTPLRSKKILALTKIKLNKVDEAIELINDNLKLQPKDADLHALLGHAYLRKNEALKSISNLKQAIKLDNNNPIYHINLARAYLSNKNTSLAISEATNALELKPNSEQARQVLVSAHFLNKNTDKAQQIVEAWIKETPDNILALSISASLEQKLSNLSKARTRLLKILTLDPYNASANLSLVRFDIKDKNTDKAYERITTILSKQPEDLLTLSILLKLALNTPTQDKAIQILSAVYNQNPLAINSRLTLAQLYINKKQAEKSLPLLEDILKINNKNIQAYLLKAKVLVQLNKIEDAKNNYKIIASLAPNNPVGQSQLALLHFKLKEYSKAIEQANKALKIDQKHIPAHIINYNSAIKTKNTNLSDKSIKSIKTISPDSHLAYEMEADYQISIKKYGNALINLKQAWKKTKNIQLANKILQTKLQLNQKDTAFDAWDELASLNRKNLKLQIVYSLALQKNKFYEKAQQVIESQLKTFPGNAILLNNLANLYFELNDKRSIETAKQALKKFPDNPAVQDTVGWIYVKQFNDYEKGLPLLRSAYDKFKSKEIKEHLISALKAAGKNQEAEQLN